LFVKQLAQVPADRIRNENNQSSLVLMRSPAMNTAGTQGPNFHFLSKPMPFRRGLAFGAIIIAALIAFEIFNFSTTDYALGDLLGDLKFAGVRWSTILALAFCGIDFAGIARLFTPEENSTEITEVWYLFGAWLLAATMNAMLTWWGVSLAIINHSSLGGSVIARETLLRAVPIFVAVMVWLIRVLIIGTFSVAGERLFSQADRRAGAIRGEARVRSLNSRPSTGTPVPSPRPLAASSTPAFRPAPKPAANAQPDPGHSRQEPTYHPVSMSPSSSNNPHTRR
jgi:hypothetical protein